MKKILFILVTCMSFCLTGCKDKNGATDSVVGDWYSSYNIVSYLDTDNGGGYVSEKEYYSINLYIHEDHSFTWNSEGGNTYGTWLQNGKQLKLSFEGGSTLYEDLLIYTIETLTTKEMVLRWDLENGYVDYYFTRR